MEREGQAAAETPLSCGEDRESWQKEIAARPLGTLPSSGPNKGAVGRSPTGMEQNPGGLTWDKLPAHTQSRDTLS